MKIIPEDGEESVMAYPVFLFDGVPYEQAVLKETIRNSQTKTNVRKDVSEIHSASSPLASAMMRSAFSLYT